MNSSSVRRPPTPMAEADPIWIAELLKPVLYALQWLDVTCSQNTGTSIAVNARRGGGSDNDGATVLGLQGPLILFPKRASHFLSAAKLICQEPIPFELPGEMQPKAGRGGVAYCGEELQVNYCQSMRPRKRPKWPNGPNWFIGSM